MTTDWAHLITPASLKSDFDAGTIQRGSAYARQRRLVGVSWDEGKRRLTGRCQGSGVSQYSMKVVFSHLGQGWKIADASCTCPVGYFCKHTVALLLGFARDSGTAASHVLPQSPPRPPDWEQRLRPLLTGPAEPTAKLALQLFVSTLDPLRRRSAPQIALRLMRPGTRTEWIRTGIDWPGLMQASFSTFDPRQLSILRMMARDSTQTNRYGLPNGLILETAPMTIWQQLDDALAAGIPILGDPASGIAEVRLVTQAALTVDLSGDYGEDAHLTVEMAIDGTVLAPDEVTLLGKPDPHGLCWIDDAGMLTLAPFDPQLRHVAALIRTQPVVIPAADAARFTAEILPRLVDSVPTRVRDGLFSPPTVIGPVGLLTVSFTEAVAHTHWAVRYLVNDQPYDFDTESSGGAARWRNPDAERALWQQLRGAMTSLVMIDDRAVLKALAAYTGGGYPVGVIPPFDEIEQAHNDEAVAAMTTEALRRDAHLNRIQTARLCGEVLPALQGRDDLVVEIGDTPARFRLVTEQTRVRFSASESSGSDWLGLDVTMDVDGEQVPLADLIAELSTNATHMLLPSGVYFPLDSPELTRLKALMEEAEKLGELKEGRANPAPLNVTLWEDLLHLGVVDEQLKGWQERIAKLSAAEPPVAVEPPLMLRATLRDYQLEGLTWLSFLWDNGIGGILADDMGLGKTLQTLALFGRARERGETGRFLVVAPTSVVNNWVAECHRFTDLTAVAVTATQKKSKTPLTDVIAGADIVITTYTLLRLDFDALDELDWAGMVLDEAQFVKNHTSKNHQFARRLDTAFKLAITGTPMENNLMELWSLLSITVPGLFPSPRSFADYFRKPIEKGEDPDRLPILRKRIKPVMLRRTKDQVARDLPAKQEQTIDIELSPKHRKIYDTRLVREREIVLGLLGDFEKNRFQIFRSLTMLRQLSLHAGLIDSADADVTSEKITFILEQLKELIAEGHSALVFSSFTGFLGILRQALDANSIRYSYLDGSLSARERAAAIENFTGGKTQVFLISLKAGGFGLNLTEADYCFVCDPWWNPAAEAQAIDRTHRIGQRRPVTVYRLVSADTIESKVVALQERKRALFTAVVDDGEMFSSAVAADDIRNMLE
ncbi:SWIM zinc finger protein [Williamsia limnetica]|uniref:SWIM zinc finger protein n=1 Tax=Williamsia limnetica TaxID=882452 RepID=A0A318RNV8_WILLI|nr:DEAD/DEAH box helicase [Williamsia limnetica]PYE17609.1 SWIM zinc finger protein [Williamsia limnetica]